LRFPHHFFRIQYQATNANSSFANKESKVIARCSRIANDHSDLIGLPRTAG
jgi:hypothetical protein